MRFLYTEAMTDPTYYGTLARAADECGYDGMVVPDSIFYPRDSDSTYPYTADGDRRFLDDKPFLDPFVLIAALAAQTTRLRFITFVLKLAIRHPVLVAKQAASLAALFEGRLALGVGISPWPDDFAVLDVPWAGRGRRMDECMQIVRGLLDGGYVEHHGAHFDMPALKITPTPAQRVPLLVGGHSDAALRRAATLGDGWMHAGGGNDDLPTLLDRLDAARRAAGRQDEPFEITVASIDAFTVDGVRKLEDAGVTDVIVGFRWPYVEGPDQQPLQEKLDYLRRFADDVIAKVHG